MKKALSLLFLFLLMGCSQVQTPASTPTMEIQGTPTETPWPTVHFPPTSTPLPTATPVPLSEEDLFTFEQGKRIGRGVNLGNALEAPTEGEWGMVLEEEYFDLIQKAGFNSVRVPIRWNAHAKTEAPYTIDPEFFARVDWVVEQATSRNLVVILNIHHYDEGIHSEPEKHKERFLALWKQISEHYQDAPDSVYFEPLNEPNGILGKTDAWSKLVAEAIDVIRATNPKRTVVVGPGEWNNLSMLDSLELPADDRGIIVTFHYYSPFYFTHQGAEWVNNSNPWLGSKWEGTLFEKDVITREFDTVLKWSQEHGRPIFLGEFGAYSKADMESRERWTAYIARSAEERGFSWAYWEFGSGFGVYDREKHEWIEPLLRALIPNS